MNAALISRRGKSTRFNTSNFNLDNMMINNIYPNYYSIRNQQLSNNIFPTEYSYPSNINYMNTSQYNYFKANVPNLYNSQRLKIKRNFSTPAIFSPKINLNSPPLNITQITPTNFSTLSKNSNDSSQNHVNYSNLVNYQISPLRHNTSLNKQMISNRINYNISNIPNYIIPIQKIYKPNISSFHSFNKESNDSNISFNNNNNLNTINSLNRSIRKINMRPNTMQRNLSFSKDLFVPKISENILNQNQNSPNRRLINSIRKIPINNNVPKQKLNDNIQNIENSSTSPNSIEPGENFNLDEFKIIKQIGSGSYGETYCVEWIKNKKRYALKKEAKKTLESLKRNLEKTKMLLDFIKKTNSPGVIKVYGFMYQNRGKYFMYYELMEIAERDWEQELFIRQKYSKYYTESELFIILTQLITTLSLLQKNHITHRDVKPQNVLISKGIYKICDFGEARTLIRDGVVCSRVRGTELYMSPILFHGLHVKLVLVNHNTYKSDVFSLGMCIFFAATLTFDSLCDIRELNDMGSIKDVLLRYLIGRYSFKFINVLLEMLQVDENLRPDFVQLEKKFFSK